MCGRTAERRRRGWWLPAAGPGSGRGRGVGEVREGGDAPAAGGRRVSSPPKTDRAAAVAGEQWKGGEEGRREGGPRWCRGQRRRGGARGGRRWRRGPNGLEDG
ncbi:hypothetical protein PAHAL_1G360800 [Panicum hallii]|uniref:Uncharacterized protein n=1 Tax=Panicum hallii TaxID=206008 RepID=A0A2T8KXC0_9POAL|nr:hypothetical protein PAHAL_1G360800 [Panicum hallii]